MGIRDRKARLAVLEKAHAPTAGLSYMQAQITNSKTSMSTIACFLQLSSGIPPDSGRKVVSMRKVAWLLALLVPALNLASNATQSSDPSTTTNQPTQAEENRLQ